MKKIEKVKLSRQGLDLSDVMVQFYLIVDGFNELAEVIGQMKDHQSNTTIQVKSLKQHLTAKAKKEISDKSTPIIDNGIGPNFSI